MNKITNLINECIALEMECIKAVSGKKSLFWVVKGSQKNIKTLKLLSDNQQFKHGCKKIIEFLFALY